MPPIISTSLLLILSNLFMTFAWYGHLKTMRSQPLMYAVLVSWGIAFFEYLIQVPANRIGYGSLSLGQLTCRKSSRWGSLCLLRFSTWDNR